MKTLKLKNASAARIVAEEERWALARALLEDSSRQKATLIHPVERGMFAQRHGFRGLGMRHCWIYRTEWERSGQRWILTVPREIRDFEFRKVGRLQDDRLPDEVYDEYLSKGSVQ